LYLIRKGAFPGGVMLDAVDFAKSRINTPDRTAFEEGYKFGEKMTPNAPKPVDEPPRRIVTDDDYDAFVNRLRNAEDAAKKDQVGIWSEKFRELREEEGIQ
jgi:hypothetical protein